MHASRFVRPLLVFGPAALAALAPATAWASEAAAEPGAVPPVWMVGFFVAMLLCIAIIPLTKLEHFWHSNLNKLLVGLGLAAYPLIWLLVLEPNPDKLLHTMHEYFSFIVLLGTLFYVTGGILLTGDLKASPETNFKFLLVGTLSASLVGTTGASMLLIRPLVRTNSERRYKVHVVIFFIFLVSNIGGSLLPIGDPPLFLGYLKGVPFLWTLSLWKEMLLTCGILLAIFYFLDRHFYKRESDKARKLDATNIEPLRIEGKFNLVWLLGIVLCVALIGPEYGFLREAAMIACAAASRFTTEKQVRERNQFSWFPIIEVAALFIGIFLTMIPALMLLETKGGELGVDTPAKFFWASGILSSFLDNAPTYLVFFSTAQGMVNQGALGGEMVDPVGVPFVILQAISCGSVFMGANSYIGNGPNFMVKAIAEELKVEMPSFFGYMKWSVGILIPTFILVTFVFFWF
jgi:Na+/H+ antiporter NhaD/arsenite permease-like protein